MSKTLKISELKIVFYCKYFNLIKRLVKVEHNKYSIQMKYNMCVIELVGNYTKAGHLDKFQIRYKRIWNTR
jgi:hypothetical protein